MFFKIFFSAEIGKSNQKSYRDDMLEAVARHVKYYIEIVLDCF
jgi:hypothetical protein